MISLGDLFSRTTSLVDQNSTGILTGIGVAGTITTALLAVKGTFRAAEIIERRRIDILGEMEVGPTDDDPLSDFLGIPTEEKLKLIWKEYLPAIGMGSLTILSIIMANRIASKEVAALTAAYSLSDRAFQEYKTKVVEKLGEGKERDIRDQIAQDRVTNNPPLTNEIVITGNGEHLCMDGLSGRYFTSTMETIRQAQNKLNYRLINHDYASLSEFYDYLGLPPTTMSDNVGWNVNTILEIDFSTALTKDGRPCIVMNFQINPFTEYAKPMY
jgi:hypothetical protein